MQSAADILVSGISERNAAMLTINENIVFPLTRFVVNEVAWIYLLSSFFHLPLPLASLPTIFQ